MKQKGIARCLLIGLIAVLMAPTAAHAGHIPYLSWHRAHEGAYAVIVIQSEASLRTQAVWCRWDLPGGWQGRTHARLAPGQTGVSYALGSPTNVRCERVRWLARG